MYKFDYSHVAFEKSVHMGQREATFCIRGRL